MQTIVLLALVLLSPLPFASPLDLMGGSGDQRTGLPALGPPPAYAAHSSPTPPWIESIGTYFGPGSVPFQSFLVTFNATLDPATVSSGQFIYYRTGAEDVCFGSGVGEVLDGNRAIRLDFPSYFSGNGIGNLSAGSTHRIGIDDECASNFSGPIEIVDTDGNSLHLDQGADLPVITFAAASPTAISAVEASPTLITARIIADGVAAEYVNATSNPATAFVVEGRTVSSWEIASDSKTIHITVSGAGDAGLTRTVQYVGGAETFVAGTAENHFIVPSGISGSAPSVGFSAARTGPDTIRLDFDTAGLPARSLSGNEAAAPFSLSAGTVDGWSVSDPTPALSPFSLDWPDAVYPALGIDEEFGAAVAAIGDIDSNGASDYAVGARSTGDSINGSVYIIRMADNNGAVLGVARIAHTDVASPPGAGSGFGSALAGLGPLSSGGLPAVAVGAPHSGNAGTPGLVYVIFLSPDGTVDSSARFDREDSTTSANSNNDRFGAALAAAGDRNGDGVPDLWVGAPFATPGGDGGLVLALLNDNGTAIDVADGTNWVPTDPSHRNRFAYNEADRFGSAIADIGDVNGDGNGDIAVGVPSSFGGSSGLRIVLLGPDHNLTDPVGIGLISDNTDLYGNGDGNGVSVAGIGDANGDGIPDVAVGSSRSNGYFSIAYLDSSGELSSFDDIRRNAAGFDPAIRSDAQFGASLAHIGDIDGNGVPDLLVGSPLQHGAADDTGSVSFVSAYASPSISLEVSGLDGAAAPTVSYDASVGDVSSRAHGASFSLDDASATSADRARPSLVTATASGAEIRAVFSEPLNATGLRPAGFAVEGFEVQSAVLDQADSKIAVITLTATADGSDPVLSVTSAVQDAAGNAAVPRAGALSVLDGRPVLGGMAISSSNDNGDYAKAGDTLTVTVSYSGQRPSSITGTIAGIDAVTDSIGASQAVLTALVAEGTPNGDAEIDLTLANSIGSTRALTADLDGDNVIVDTKPPELHRPSYIRTNNPADNTRMNIPGGDDFVGWLTVVGADNDKSYNLGVDLENHGNPAISFQTGVQNGSTSIDEHINFGIFADYEGPIRISIPVEDKAGNEITFTPDHANYTGPAVMTSDKTPPGFRSASYSDSDLSSVLVSFNEALSSADATKYAISYNDSDSKLITQSPSAATVSDDAVRLALPSPINASGGVLVSLEQGAVRDRTNIQSAAAANQTVSVSGVYMYTTGNPGYAKAQDRITVSIDLDKAAESYSGTIAGQTVPQQDFSISDDKLTLNATITVSSGLPQGEVQFEINATNASIVATYTQASLTSDNISIDTVLPVLNNATFYTTTNPADPSYLTSGGSIRYEIGFSEDGPDFDIVLGGSLNRNIASISRNNMGYASATVGIHGSFVTGDGPVAISFNVSDFAGNSAVFTQDHANFASTITVDDTPPAFASAAYSSARPLLLTVEFNDVLTSVDATKYAVSYNDSDGDTFVQVPASASFSGDTATLAFAEAINATGDFEITLEQAAARDRGNNPSAAAANQPVSTSGVTISTTGNTGYAKAGDSITVTIALEHAPILRTGTIAGHTLAHEDFAVDGNTVAATITVDSSSDEGDVSFDINITGAGDVLTRATQANLSGSNIEIDVTRPAVPNVTAAFTPEGAAEIGLDSVITLSISNGEARWAANVTNSQAKQSAGTGGISFASSDITPYEGEMRYNAAVYDAAGNNNTAGGEVGYADLLRPALGSLTISYGNLSTVLANFDEGLAGADADGFSAIRQRGNTNTTITVDAAEVAGEGSMSVNLTLGSPLQDGDRVFVTAAEGAVNDTARNGPSPRTLSAPVAVPVDFVYSAVRNGTDSIVLSFMVNGTPVQGLGAEGGLAGAFALDSGSVVSATATDPLFARPDYAIDWPAAGNFSLSENDRFGSGAAVIGDIDSNGAQDYAIGAFDGSAGSNVRDGAVYIFRMADSRTVLGATKIPYSDIAGLGADEWFSKAIAGLGPLSEGGLPAIAVSAPRTGADQGQVYVMFLNPNGTLASHATLDTASISNRANTDNERLGWSLAAAGDRNGDSVPDLWVGAPRANDGGTRLGIVYLAYLNANGTAIDQTNDDNQLGGSTSALNVDNTNQLGISVADIGDINGDNRSDIAVGMTADIDDNDSSTNGEGQIRVILTGNDDDLSSDITVRSLGNGVAGVPALSPGDLFGWAVAGIGDANYDGIPDIAASDRVGSIHVLLMSDDGTASSSYAIASNAAGLSPAIDSDGDFGFSLAHIGDIDSDGVPELLAGSQNHDDGASNTGAASIISVLDTPRLVLGTSGVTGSAAVPVVSYNASAGARITANYTGAERALEDYEATAADGVRPTLESAETLSPEIVRATFDEPLSEGSLVAGAFLVAGQAAVSAEIDPDNENAALVRAAGTIGGSDEPLVNATGAQDVSGNAAGPGGVNAISGFVTGLDVSVQMRAVSPNTVIVDAFNPPNEQRYAKAGDVFLLTVLSNQSLTVGSGGATLFGQPVTNVTSYNGGIVLIFNYTIQPGQNTNVDRDSGTFIEPDYSVHITDGNFQEVMHNLTSLVPTIDSIVDTAPPNMTRVTAYDGYMIAEFDEFLSESSVDAAGFTSVPPLTFSSAELADSVEDTFTPGVVDQISTMVNLTITGSYSADTTYSVTAGASAAQDPAGNPPTGTAVDSSPHDAAGFSASHPRQGIITLNFTRLGDSAAVSFANNDNRAFGVEGAEVLSWQASNASVSTRTLGAELRGLDFDDGDILLDDGSFAGGAIVLNSSEDNRLLLLSNPARAGASLGSSYGIAQISGDGISGVIPYGAQNHSSISNTDDAGIGYSAALLEGITRPAGANYTVALGAPGRDSPTTDRGGITISFFNLTGHKVGTDIDIGAGGSGDAGDRLGLSLDSARLDAGGTSDLIVGTNPAEGFGRTLYIFYLDADGSVSNTRGQAGIHAGAYVGEFGGRKHVAGISSASDSVLVYELNADGIGFGPLASTITASSLGLHAGALGEISSLAGPGDLNGDGNADLVIGARADNGSIVVAYLDESASPIRAVSIDAYTPGGPAGADRAYPGAALFPYYVSAGDLNGDGDSEIFASIIGAQSQDDLEYSGSNITHDQAEIYSISVSEGAAGFGRIYAQGLGAHESPAVSYDDAHGTALAAGGTAVPDGTDSKADDRSAPRLEAAFRNGSIFLLDYNENVTVPGDARENFISYYGFNASGSVESVTAAGPRVTLDTVHEPEGVVLELGTGAASDANGNPTGPTPAIPTPRYFAASSAAPLSAMHILVNFTGALNSTSIESGSFAVDGGVNVTSARLFDERSVVLETTPLSDGREYTVTVSGVRENETGAALAAGTVSTGEFRALEGPGTELFPPGSGGIDSYGSAIASLGDVDGDGVPDIAVGSSGEDGPDRNQQGSVRVLFMNGNGTVRESSPALFIDRVNLGDTGPTVTTFGAAVAPLGDLDGDGVPDLAISAPFSNSGVGSVYVALLSADGSHKRVVGPILGPTDRFNNRFGYVVDAPGDLNGDGVPDLLVAETPLLRGDELRVYAVHLNDDGSASAPVEIADEEDIGTPVRVSVVNPVSMSALAPLGDINGDGGPDFAAGIPISDGQAFGRIHVLFFDSSLSLSSVRVINGTQFGAEPSAYFGADVAAIGDLDGDGIAEIAVGAPGITEDPSVYIVSLNADGSAKWGYQVRGDGNVALPGTFGWSVAALPDYDGNGLPDLAVGTSTENTVAGSSQRDTVYRLSLLADDLVTTVQGVSSTSSGKVDAGTFVTVRVEFTGPVDEPTSGSRLNMSTGGQATYSTIAGDSLVFSYTVDAADKANGLETDGIGAFQFPTEQLQPDVGPPVIAVLPVPGSAGSLSDNSFIVLGDFEPAKRSLAASPGGFVGLGQNATITLVTNTVLSGATATVFGVSVDPGRIALSETRVPDDTVTITYTAQEDDAGPIAFNITASSGGASAHFTDLDDPSSAPVFATELLRYLSATIDPADSTRLILSFSADIDNTTIAAGDFAVPQSRAITGVSSDGPLVYLKLDGAVTGGAVSITGEIRDTAGNPISSGSNTASGFVATSARALTATAILVEFSSDINTDTVTGNYTINGSIDIRDAFASGSDSVTLIVSPLADGQAYMVTPQIDAVNASTGGRAPLIGVETAKFAVLSAASEITLAGLSGGDGFGAGIAAVGDVDGDGIVDLAAGAPFDDTGASGAGAVYILFMNSNGSIRDSAKIANPASSPADDWFGYALAAMGDVDGNGVPDLAASASGILSNAADSGFYVLLLNSSGLAQEAVFSGRDLIYSSQSVGSARYALALASWPDVDGNGIADLLINIEGSGSNHDYAIRRSIGPDGAITGSPGLHGVTLSIPIGINQRAFYSLAYLGDIDGDGTIDYAAGAPEHDGAASQAGAVLIIDATAVLTSANSLHDGTGASSGLNLAAEDRFGSSVASIGDLDGDGVPEILVGAPGAPILGDRQQGYVTVMSVDSDGAYKWSYRIDRNTAGVSFENKDDFGHGAAVLPDYDGNGLPDIAIGAAAAVEVDSSVRGKIHVISPHLDESVVTVKNVTSTSSGQVRAEAFVPIAVEFTGPVGAPVPGSTISLNTGGNASHSANLEDDTIVFLYKVRNEDSQPSLDYAGIGALQFSGDSIRADNGPLTLANLPYPGAAGSLSANTDIIAGDIAPQRVSLTVDSDGLIAQDEEASITLVTNVQLTGATASILDGGITGHTVELGTTRITDDTVTVTFSTASQYNLPLEFSITATSGSKSEEFTHRERTDTGAVIVDSRGLGAIGASIHDARTVYVNFNKTLDNSTIAPLDFIMSTGVAVSGASPLNETAVSVALGSDIPNLLVPGNIIVQGEISDPAGNDVPTGTGAAIDPLTEITVSGVRISGDNEFNPAYARVGTTLTVSMTLGAATHFAGGSIAGVSIDNSAVSYDSAGTTLTATAVIPSSGPRQDDGDVAFNITLGSALPDFAVTQGDLEGDGIELDTKAPSTGNINAGTSMAPFSYLIPGDTIELIVGELGGLDNGPHNTTSVTAYGRTVNSSVERGIWPAPANFSEDGPVEWTVTYYDDAGNSRTYAHDDGIVVGRITADSDKPELERIESTGAHIIIAEFDSDVTDVNSTGFALARVGPGGLETPIDIVSAIRNNEVGFHELVTVTTKIGTDLSGFIQLRVFLPAATDLAGNPVKNGSASAGTPPEAEIRAARTGQETVILDFAVQGRAAGQVSAQNEGAAGAFEVSPGAVESWRVLPASLVPPITHIDYENSSGIISGGAGTQLGVSAALLGDLDGNGAQDYVFGSRDRGPGDSHDGAVNVVLMADNYTVLNVTRIAHGDVSDGPGDGGRFGSGLASLGPLAPGGLHAVAAGAEQSGTDGANAGAVYVLFLNTDGTLDSSARILRGDLGAGAAAAQDRFGRSVAAAPDRDGSGAPDLWIGAPGAGRVFLASLTGSGAPVGTAQAVLGASGDAFGTSVAEVGDIDGDGLPDIAVGAPDRSDGAVYLVRLRANGSSIASVALDKDDANMPDTGPSDDFGISVSGVLGPGGYTGDVLVGSRADGGTAYVISTDGLASSGYSATNRDTAGGPAIAGADDQFGAIALAAIGDIDSDGAPDYAASAVNHDRGSVNNAGRVYFASVYASQSVELTVSGLTGTGERPAVTYDPTVTGIAVGAIQLGAATVASSDRLGPRLDSARVSSPTAVAAVFSEPLNSSSAIPDGAFQINGTDAGVGPISGSTVLLRPATDIQEGQLVTVRLASAHVQDMFGNAAGLGSKDTSVFAAEGPPRALSASISSNNVHGNPDAGAIPHLARAGNTLTVSASLLGLYGSASGTILGQPINASYSADTRVFSASAAVPGGFNGPAEFSITLSNADGDSVMTQANLTSGNVRVDNIPPDASTLFIQTRSDEDSGWRTGVEFGIGDFIRFASSGHEDNACLAVALQERDLYEEGGSYDCVGPSDYALIFSQSSDSIVGDGRLNFTFSLSDAAYNEVLLTEQDFDPIYIDTFRPEIDYIGLDFGEPRSIDVVFNDEISGISAAGYGVTVERGGANSTAAIQSAAAGSGTRTAAITLGSGLQAGDAVFVNISSSAAIDNARNRPEAATVRADFTEPPTASAVSMTSDNDSPLWARAGDTITVSMEVNGQPRFVSGTIAGQPATGAYNETSMMLEARAQVGSGQGQAQGPAEFELVIGNSVGQATVTRANLTGDGVSVDTRDPVLLGATFSSNNPTSAAYAKYGDSIRLNFSLSEQASVVYAPSIDGAEIGTISATASAGSYRQVDLAYESPDPGSGAASYALAAEDAAGNSVVFTQDHANSTGEITADNTPPAFDSATYSRGDLSLVSVKFNETLGSADHTKYAVSYENASGSQSQAPASASVSGQTAMLQLPEDILANNGTVTITLQAGAASDRARNPSPAISAQDVMLLSRPVPLDVSVYTTNDNASYARAGDEVTVSIQLGGMPTYYTAVIAGQALAQGDLVLEGLTLNGTITVQDGSPQGTVQFSFVMNNSFGPERATQANASDMVTIDTQDPPAPVVSVARAPAAGEIGLDTTVTLTLDSEAHRWTAAAGFYEDQSGSASEALVFGPDSVTSPGEGEATYVVTAYDAAGNDAQASGSLGHADLVRPNATGITLRPSENATISVKFDEQLSEVTMLGFAVRTDNSTGTNDTVAVTDAQITGPNRDIVLLSLGGELSDDSNAYVTVAPAAARDAARNSPAGTVTHSGSLSGFDVVSAKAESARTILVTFAVELLPASVEASNFALSLQDIGVNSAAPSGRTVLLTTDADINAALPMNLTVSGLIEDADRTTEAANKRYVVITDYVPPMIDYVRHSAASIVQVGFDEPVQSSSLSAENFRLNAGAVISAAANGPSNATLTVRTDGGQRVTVTASNILDSVTNGQGQSSSLQAASSYAESLPLEAKNSNGSTADADFATDSEPGGALTTDNDKTIQITVPARGGQPSYTVTVVLPDATYSPVGGSDAGSIPVYAGSGRIPASVADPEAARDASIGDPETDYTVGGDKAVRITINSSGLADPVAYYIPSDGRAAEVDSCADAPYSDQSNAYNTTDNAGANLAAIGEAQSCYTNSSSSHTIWSNHMTTFGVSERGRAQPSGGDDCSDCQSPTLGRASSGAQLVSGGFSFNGRTVDVGRYHTPSPLITTSVNATNTVGIKVYENYGPEHVKRVEFALGVPEVGAWYDAEAFIEVWFERSGLGVKEIVIVDPLDVIGDETVSASASAGSCSAALNEDQCMHMQLQFAYREAPAYNTMGVKPVDFAGYAHQFYFNDGIDVTGESLNLPAEIDIAVSHAVDHPQRAGLIHLVQTDRAAGLWTDQYGLVWHIEGGIVKQITVPDHIVPADNVIGQHSGLDRHHPLFEQYRELQHARALETLAEILGTDDTSKALPESETIIFEAVSEKREGAEFQLRLEIEGQRVAELVKELYG